MFAFDGRDAEGLSFFQRFIVHDHFARLGSGVYSSTPGGTFTFKIDSSYAKNNASGQEADFEAKLKKDLDK